MTKDSRISKLAVLWLIPNSFNSIFQYLTIFIIFLLSSCATFDADKYINYQGKVEISYNKEILRSNMLIKYTNNELIIQLYRPLIGTLFEYDIKFNENFIFQENFFNYLEQDVLIELDKMNIISNTRSCMIHKKLVMTDGYTCKYNEGKIYALKVKHPNVNYQLEIIKKFILFFNIHKHSYFDILCFIKKLNYYFYLTIVCNSRAIKHCFTVHFRTLVCLQANKI